MINNRKTEQVFIAQIKWRIGEEGNGTYVQERQKSIIKRIQENGTEQRPVQELDK